MFPNDWTVIIKNEPQPKQDCTSCTATQFCSGSCYNDWITDQQKSEVTYE